MRIRLDFSDVVTSPPQPGVAILMAWSRNGPHGWNAMIWDPSAVSEGDPLELGDCSWAPLPDPAPVCAGAGPGEVDARRRSP